MKVMGLELTQNEIDLAEKLIDERFAFIESIMNAKKLDGENSKYQDEANVYFSIKIAQLIKRVEFLESIVK